MGGEILAIAYDVTDRKQAEEDLDEYRVHLEEQVIERTRELRNEVAKHQAAEDRFRLSSNVFTHARGGIIITDAVGTIIEVNDTFTATTGYSREEAIGQNPRILQSDRQGPEFYADMRQVLLETGFWSGEVWNRRKNTEVYAEMLNISSVENDSGQISNYIAFFTDITLVK